MFCLNNTLTDEIVITYRYSRIVSMFVFLFSFRFSFFVVSHKYVRGNLPDEWTLHFNVQFPSNDVFETWGECKKLTILNLIKNDHLIMNSL